MMQVPLIDEHVENMLHYDVIELAVSLRCSVMMVRKCDGTVGFFVDYRKTHEVIKNISFLYLRLTRVSTLNRCGYFSSCDLH